MNGNERPMVRSGSADTVNTTAALLLDGFGSGVVLDAVAEKVIVPSVAGATKEMVPPRVCPRGISPRLHAHVSGTFEAIDSVTAVAVSGPSFRTWKKIAEV